MLRKLPVNSLRPGMYIADDVLANLDSPFLYCIAGMLEHVQDIEAIRNKGYREAFVDLERSHKEWQLLYGGADEAILSSVFADPLKPAALAPQITLQEELPQAKQLFAQTLYAAQRIMTSFKNSGRADIEAGSKAVEGIAASVSRNANALLAISKLRTKDDYTFAHCVNVATAAVIFARHLGYDGSALHMIGLTGFFHDLGKMEIPEEILNSPRRLTPEEFSIIREHPAIGHKHLKRISGLPDPVVLGALEHHERLNGSGYPNGKKGNEISLAGKLLAIVDRYDALSSQRPYKEAITPHTSLGLLYGMRGEDLVPELVDRFIQCLGIYPPGSFVQLSNKLLAVVSQVDPEEPLRPQLILVRQADGHNALPRLIDLKIQRDLQITQCLDPSKHGLDLLSVLEQHAR
jgi:HD-GYP domain-containing protein (c-di-GMP phosphodiesterase class II)